MKTLTDSQLKIATVFDLTDDLELIEAATGLTPDREAGLKENETGRIFSMLEFAEETGDTKLNDRLEKIFSKELKRLLCE